ncbi:MAG: hypothetical protein ACE5GZ_03405 [Gammaproteobacteria bacterium]
MGRILNNSHEADPMSCPQCGETMRIMALIEDPPVVERLWKHLRLRDPRPTGHACLHATHRQAPPTEDLGWPENSQIPLTYAAVPDSA